MKYMTGPAREEMDAKLEVLEVRIDARIVAFSARIDALVARFDEFEKHLDQRMAEMNRRGTLRMDGMEKRYGAIIASIDQRFSNFERDVRNLKNTVIVTAGSATLATVFGMARRDRPQAGRDQPPLHGT